MHQKRDPLAKFGLFLAALMGLCILRQCLLPAEAHAQVKLSQIASGGSLASSTDKLIGVRSGTTDVLLTVGSACVENLSSIVVDNGAGALTLGAGQVTNAMLVNAATTVNGQTCTLGSTCTVSAVTSVATNGTLTGGPITTTGTLGINLANANTWTAGQTFQAAAGSIAAQFRSSGTQGLTVYPNVMTLNPASVFSLNSGWFSVNQNIGSSLNVTSGMVFGFGRTGDGTTFGNDTYAPSTAVNVAAAEFQTIFNPVGSSPGYAAVEVNPTVNGTSTGVATALAVASKTNTLTGGTINLIDAGTTTTDYFTGYTSKFKVDTTGAITGIGTGLTGTAASLTAGAANAISSATTTINVSSATAPTSGQVLTATSSTAATWQTASGGSSALTSAVNTAAGLKFGGL